jgi:ArsR family transcriptional regulator, arsenate/arsenite/antimonite-responsive transcriptional repressor
MKEEPRPPSAVFRALADETRRQILDFLRPGRRTSGEIAEQFQSSWPTISRHLAVLRAAGLVVTERKGQAIFYELNTSVFQDLIQHLVGWLKPSRQTAPARRRTQEASPPVVKRQSQASAIAVLAMGYLVGLSAYPKPHVRARDVCS